MKTLYIEQSTCSARRGDWVMQLDLEGVERIVVGTGPGSFAGIRSALAFAQGYALGKPCDVLGLPSACAVAAQVYAALAEDPASVRIAVIGDARRSMAWVALFEGFGLLREIFQVEQNRLRAAVPDDFRVATPDAARIDAPLREMFGDRYLGGRTPDAEGLKHFAEANPAILAPEPLPIYLNPAVR